MNRGLLKDLIRSGPQPIQPNLISASTNLHTKYVEWNPFAIKNGSLFYQFTIKEGINEKAGIIPDGCPSILFKCGDNPKAVINGVRTAPGEMNIHEKTTFFVFKPHSLVGAKLGDASQKDLYNTYADFEDLFGDISLAEQISEASDFEERTDLFMKFAMEKMLIKEYNPDVPEYVAMMMCLSKGEAKMSEIIDQIGYTEKYCRLKFKSEYGFSPKLYSRIMRLQGALNEINFFLKEGQHVCMTDVMCDAGYFDQSHFIREFKEFTGMTPRQYVQMKKAERVR